MNTEFSSIFYEDKVDISDHYAKRMAHERDTHKHDGDTLKNMQNRDRTLHNRDSGLSKDAKNELRKSHSKYGSGYIGGMDYQMEGRKQRKDMAKEYNGKGLKDYGPGNSNDRKRERKASNECGLMDYDLI